MLYRATSQTIGCALAVIASTALSACDGLRHKSSAAAQAETKRQQAACASPAAYERLKDSIFDKAIAQRSDNQANLDTLADYSIARMENPVVKGWDRSLDITRCEGHFVLEVPPGAETGLGGERQLQADLRYTAQASADGGGLVYEQHGAEPIIAKLAAFKLSPALYRPPPAIDQDQAASDRTEQVPVREAPQQPSPSTPPAPSVPNVADRLQQPERGAQTEEASKRASPTSRLPAPTAQASERDGEATVRSFYGALGTGDGAAASSHIIPEKRSSRAFSPAAISRFYGHLREPLHLTSVAPAGGGSYRVTYRYSAGRSHCNGVALVRLTNRGGRDLITSIRSLSGC